MATPAFAIFGTLVGTAVVVSGKATPPVVVADLTYHIAILTVLTAGLVFLVLPGSATGRARR